MSHFTCKEEECLQQKFIVFRNKEELESHTNKAHRKLADKGGKTKISLACTEFRYENGGKVEGSDFNKILDSEGVDMSKQLVSLQKVKFRYNRKDEIWDDRFDIRDFLENIQKKENFSAEQERALVRKVNESNKGKKGKGGRRNKNRPDEENGDSYDRRDVQSDPVEEFKEIVYLEDIQ